MTRALGSDPMRRCLPLSEWPRRDRAGWERALSKGDVLEPGGERSRHRVSANRTLAGGYGRWLTFLSGRGALAPDVPPAERITRERVSAYLAELQTQVSTATQERRVVELRLMAELLDPPGDWRWLRRLAAAVRHRHHPTRDKRARLVGADDLLDLGQCLMQQAEAHADRPGWRRALVYRDGLAIALMAQRPLRRANFATLRLDRHVVQRGPAWWLTIPGEETKNHDPIEVPWPALLVPALEAYLATWRPLLLGRYRPGARLSTAGMALWVSSSGVAMDTQALFDLVTRHTRVAFGRAVNPHMFRDCAATSIALEDPKHVRVASQVLGHRHPATTERHYNLATSVEATRHWQNLLDRLRASSDGPGPAPRVKGLRR